jgi:hypothetical protein
MLETINILSPELLGSVGLVLPICLDKGGELGDVAEDLEEGGVLGQEVRAEAGYMLGDYLRECDSPSNGAHLRSESNVREGERVAVAVLSGGRRLLQHGLKNC